MLLKLFIWYLFVKSLIFAPLIYAVIVTNRNDREK